MAEVFDVRDIEYFMGIKVFNMVLDRPGVKMGKRRGMVERCMVAFEDYDYFRRDIPVWYKEWANCVEKLG